MNPLNVMKKIFWIDLEMTGLDVNSEVIIEVGAVITDLEFHRLEDYHAVVKQPQHYLDNMDEWNTKHHTESGLVAKVPTGKSPEVVEEDLCRLVRRHFPGTDKEDRPVIAGNSISQDRLFIDRYLPNFAKLLHYRMLDVSSWKVIMQAKYHFVHDKKNKHRAVDDIHESIEEMKAYLRFFENRR